jgi:peptidoglycan/xylan/chitin deacetylase (PgdA/CDA1 family)
MTAPAGRFASPLGRVLLVAVSFGCLLLLLLAASGHPAPVWLELLAAAALIALLTCGVLFQSSGVYARPLISVRTSRPEVAITFDDGPGPHTAGLLATLAARGHRATFFVVGERATALNLAAIDQGGHAIENHSWRHSYLTPFLRPSSLAEELSRTSALIEAACGKRPRWFRPPVGLLSPRVGQAAALAGLQLVAWTATARDGVARTTAEQALSRLEQDLRPGAILVLHDAPAAVQALPRLLDLLDQRHLRSVTLSELLATAQA